MNVFNRCAYGDFRYIATNFALGPDVSFRGKAEVGERQSSLPRSIMTPKRSQSDPIYLALSTPNTAVTITAVTVLCFQNWNARPLFAFRVS